LKKEKRVSRESEYESMTYTFFFKITNRHFGVQEFRVERGDILLQ
jgi:hypothetical protein